MALEVVYNSSNVQGVLLHELIGRCNLSAVPLGSLASGPVSTYVSGEMRSSVDYVLMDVDAASMLLSCYTHPMDDFNTSDHLPLTASLKYMSPVHVGVEESQK